SLPLTGVFAIAGQKHRDGYTFWSHQVNKRRPLLGRPVELVISDNRSDTETTVSQLERFISHDGVDLLFGTFSSKLTFPASAAADEAIQRVRAFRTVRYNPKGLYLSQGSQAEFKQALGDATNGVLTHAAWHEAAPYQGLLAGDKYSNQEFIQDFQTEFKREPD